MGSEPEYEKVYTVNNYYDGPRHGVADFQGRPHVYLSRFDDYKGKADSFQLMLLNQESLVLILEDWAIWERWRLAFDSGKVQIATHPALPDERKRHEVLSLAVEKALTIIDSDSLEATGDFKVIGDEVWVHWETKPS